MSNEFTIDGALDAVAGDSPARRAVLTEMEAREHWILDRPGELVDRLLIELGELIERGAFQVPGDVRLEDVTDVLSTIRTGRFFRLLRELATQRDGFLEELANRLITAESEEPISAEYNVIRSRLLIAEQIGYLNELFSSERLEVLNLAVEDAYADDY